jgi:hypothetical protein
VAAGCAVHHAPTVNLKLPVKVAGYSKIGISNDSRVCNVVPNTLVTECDANTQPSKGSAS